MKRLAACFVVLFLGGCASGYVEFYQPTPGATPEMIAAHRAAPPPPVPTLVKTSASPQSVGDYYAREGYHLIGSASFTSGMGQSESAALDQGKRVGADLVVILNPSYAGSVQGVVPITVPTTQTSYSTGTATAYGAGGSVTAYGSGTTTTYGSTTNYIPYTINRYAYAAGFFVKQRYTLGVNTRNMTDDERRRVGTNAGLYVTSVVNGTAAFASDVLPGDILLSINGERVADEMSFSGQTQRFHGQAIELRIRRGDQEIVKKVQMGN